MASEGAATEILDLTPEGLECSLTGTDEPDAARFPLGSILADRFHVVRWIADGGMGEVYEARDMELDKPVALKMIRQEIADNQHAMKRFRREISLAQTVTHPNICRIFDFFYHSGSTGASGFSGRPASNAVVFLTMELLAGQTLSDLLEASGPMATEEALPIIRQIASALAAAHEAGVIHRDLKCSNVMLVERPRGVRAVVTDFGLARHTLDEGRAQELTASGQILGSPAYMAPEQIRGGQLTPATDIYALGVVMFRMITGQRPFEDKAPLATLAKRLYETPPSPNEIVEGLDPRWEAAILRCLERQPEERFESTFDLLRALDTKATAPTNAAMPRRPPSRSSARTLVSALLLAALVASGMTAYVFRDDSQRPPGVSTALTARRSVAVLGFKNLSGRTDADWLSTALSELLTTELAVGDHLRTIPGENVARMKRDLALPETDSLAQDTLRSVGERLNSDYIVLGSYLATGASGDGRLRLDLRIQGTAAGAAVTTLSETSTEAELLGLVARLGEDLRRELGAPAAVASSATLASMPSNLVAARLYAEGLAALRGFDFLRARDLLLEAVAAEPDYPLAHSALAEAYATLGYDGEALEQARRAFELAEDLPRQERMLVEGRYRNLTRDWDATIEIYRTLFEFFPDNLEYGLALLRVQTRAEQNDEAEATLESLRRLPAGADPRVDYQEARLASATAQYPRALAAAGETMAKSRRIGARLLAARAQLQQGVDFMSLGRLDEAESATLAAHDALLELGDRGLAAFASNLRGGVLQTRGDLDAALDAYEEVLAIFRQLGFRAGIGHALNNQALIVRRQGDLSTASQLFNESLAIVRELKDTKGVSDVLYNLASVSQSLGDGMAARRLFKEALQLSRRIDHPADIAELTLRIGYLDFVEGDLNGSRRRCQEALTIARDTDQRILIAFILQYLATIETAADDLVSARGSIEESLALNTEIGAGEQALASRLILARLTYEEERLETAAEQALQVKRESVSQQSLFAAKSEGLLAISRLAMGRPTEAREAVDRALATAEPHTDIELTASLAIVDARVRAAEEAPTEALALLRATLDKARQTNRLDLELEARLAVGEIELRSGRVDAGRATLALLEREATAGGFNLIARKAREAAERHGP